MWPFTSKKSDPTTAEKEEKHCVDCEKRTQQAAPAESTANAQCAQEYLVVAACMKEHNDQVTSCVQEWKTFKQCHEANRQSSS